MKKLLSISFAFLILLSGMHFTIATHYCGGELAATKASFSGNTASCGMEETDDSCTDHGDHVNPKSCCSDEIAVFSVDQNYTPSFTEFHSFAQHILQVYLIPASITFHSFTPINLVSTDASPPENSLIHAVSLPKICVFLI